MKKYKKLSSYYDFDNELSFEKGDVVIKNSTPWCTKHSCMLCVGRFDNGDFLFRCQGTFGYGKDCNNGVVRKNNRNFINRLFDSILNKISG